MHYIRSPREAEANAAVRMRELGFADAEVTVRGADAGIDVVSKGALAQVKWRGGMAGRPEIQNLFGARGLDTTKKLLFFSASGYTEHAKRYADVNGIALFLYEPSGELTAVNAVAEELVRSAARARKRARWWAAVSHEIALTKPTPVEEPKPQAQLPAPERTAPQPARTRPAHGRERGPKPAGRPPIRAAVFDPATGQWELKHPPS